jgi:2-haloacid dehalogenase
VDARWATFDCYGTLVDWNAGIRGELARLFGEDRTDELLAAYHRLEPEFQRDGSLSYREVMARTLAAVAGQAGAELPEHERDALGRSLPSWPVFPEVPEALSEARERGWELVILSNTDRDFIDASMAAIGVPFEMAIVASEIGSYKPAHGHWRAFYERADADPQRHVHVGASLFHDIGAANELGIPSIWINRLGESPHEGARPERELPTLAGLAGELGELVPR